MHPHSLENVCLADFISNNTSKTPTDDNLETESSLTNNSFSKLITLKLNFGIVIRYHQWST